MSGEGGAIAEVLAGHVQVTGYNEIGVWFNYACSCSAFGDSDEWHREHVAEVLADLLAAERQRGREEALREAADRVRSRREAFLDSPSLDRAWIAGWHAATDDHAAALADVPAAAEGERE